MNESWMIEDERGLGRRIKVLREDLGLSQEGLARAAGEEMSQTTVSRIERGATGLPNVYDVLRLARALGTTVELLVDPPAVTRLPQHRPQPHRPAPQELDVAAIGRSVDKLTQAVERLVNEAEENRARLEALEGARAKNHGPRGKGGG